MPKTLQDITKKQEEPQNHEAVSRPEKVEAPFKVEIEKKIEIEQPLGIIKEGKIEEEKKGAVAILPPTTAAPAVPFKSPELEKIENILEEDLEEIYFQLPLQKQEEFKKTGEETATKIEILLKAVKIKIKKILDLVRNWLRIIPGVNKFFLEQEAKIKTDKILKLEEEDFRTERKEG